MDFPPPPSPNRLPSRRCWAIGVAAVLGLYALFLSRYIGAVAGGADSSGYMNQARLLASGHVEVPFREVPGLSFDSVPDNLYVPLGFILTPDRTALTPSYPTGLALLILAFKPFIGWRHAGDLVMILHAIAGILLTYALGRTFGLGRVWAALGAAVIGASPLYLFMSLQAMSDVPALAWTTAAVIAAWRSRNRPGWALAAGILISVDVLLRPTNVLVFLPVAVALGAQRRRWLLLALGGMPGAVFFGAYNLAAYGRLFATGYGDATSTFGLRYVPGSLELYVHWLPLLLTPIAVLALGLPWIARPAPRAAILLGLWIAVYAGFYAAYEWTHHAWWFLRFLLPAAPAMVVAGLLVARRLWTVLFAGGRDAARRLVWIAAMAAIVVNTSCWNHDLSVLAIGHGESKYAVTARWLKAHVPSNAVLLVMQTSGALFYYTDFTLVRWDWLSVGTQTGTKVETAIRKAGLPLYTVLFPFEREEVLRSVMPGTWTQIGAIEDVTIWQRGSGDAKR